MHRPPPAPAVNVLVPWTVTEMVSHLLCSASCRIWTPTHRFVCNQAPHTTHHHRTVRRRSETSEDGGDRVELFVQTKIGTSSGHWKTARWRKAGPEEARAALRVGRGATCDEYTSYRGGSKEFLFSSLSMNDRRAWSSLLDLTKCWCDSPILLDRWWLVRGHSWAWTNLDGLTSRTIRVSS